MDMPLLSKSGTTPTFSERLSDTSGASIVIALVFFLICALVGSTVLTAATINAQAAATYKETRQAEYTVSSAAALVADNLQANVRVQWDWTNVSETSAPTLMPLDAQYPELFKALWQNAAQSLWSYNSTARIWQPREVELTDIEISGVEDMSTVYANITVDVDLGVTVQLTLDNDPNTISPYDETVYLQARPEYVGDRLDALTWESPLITKTGGR